LLPRGWAARFGDTASPRRRPVRKAFGFRRGAAHHRGVPVTVGTWNLENLFRPGAGAGPSDEQAYDAKLTELAR
jgi:hypothetical protein